MGDCDALSRYPAPPMENSIHSAIHSSIHQNAYAGGTEMKYATIDRSHFRRVQRQRSGSDTDNTKQRSNSVGESEEEFPDYKLNLPKNKMNTICARTAFPPGTRPSVFQLFDGQNAAQLRRQLSPASSPSKQPLTSSLSHEIQRRGSSPSAPKTAPKPRSPKKQMTLQHINVAQHQELPPPPTHNEEPEPATPGSFQAALQQKRLLMMQKKCVSVDETTTSASYL